MFYGKMCFFGFRFLIWLCSKWAAILEIKISRSTFEKPKVAGDSPEEDIILRE